jgi:S1-C subfamily serine protease
MLSGNYLRFMPIQFIILILIALMAAVVIWRGRNKLNEKRAMLLVMTRDPKKAKAAFFEMGRMIEDSGKVHESLYYYGKASELGSGQASHALAQIHFRAGALIRYFEFELKASEQGYEPAMRNIAGAYKQGQGTLKNIGKSTFWLLRSAESGNAQSMNKVALAYIEGFGVPENPMEGLAWLYVAEFKRNDEAAQLIKGAEAKLNNTLILMAQDRAKAIIDLISAGRITHSSSFPGSGPSVAGQGNPSKPKHESKGSGSGSIVSSSGHVVTAAHVIKGASYLEVVTPSGTHPAAVLSVDDANDVALLKVEQTFECHIPVGRSSEVRLGQTVATIGFPNIGIQGHSPKVTQGMISGDNGVQNDIRMWQISVPIQPGNSGGPLLDEQGRLVGVVVASLSLRAIQVTGSVPQNVNYAIKGAYLEPLLNFHKLAVAEPSNAAPASFQDMIARAQKASVLVLVY